MISIHKKRKCIKVNYVFNNTNNINIFLKFDEEQLNQIKNCNFMEYNIRDKIIINIPANINKIVFGGWFNLNAQSYLDSNILIIKFGYEFNQEINNLPSKLKHLTLGVKFNQAINNLPLGLKKLFIGGSFNQPIDLLPESLEELLLSGCFNHFVDNLPMGLKMLYITGFAFDHSINSIPNSIEILHLHPEYRIKINKLPKKLLLIKFDGYTKCKVDLNELKKITNAKIKCDITPFSLNKVSQYSTNPI